MAAQGKKGLPVQPDWSEQKEEGKHQLLAGGRVLHVWVFLGQL